MNPLKKLFAILVAQDVQVKSKLEIFERLKIEYCNDIEVFTKLHLIIGEILATGDNPNPIKTIQVAKTKNILTQKFSISIISDLIEEFNWNDTNSINSYLITLEEEYIRREILLVGRDLSHVLASENPTIDRLQKTLLKGLKLTELDSQVNDTNDEILKRVLIKHAEVQSGKSVGIELGYSNLREKVVLEDVDMMVIAARPAMGKTAFAVSTLIKLVFQQNEKVLFFALEMSKEQMMRRIISNITGISGWKIKYGKLSTEEIAIIERLKNQENWNNFEIIEGTNTADEIYFATASRKNKDKVTVLIVDYLQKIKGDAKKSKYEVVTNASNRMKELSQSLKIPTICLAQLGRGNEQRGGDKRPMLSDLRDSGEIEQDASIIAFLHRPEYYGMETNENGESTKNKGEFIVAKNRDGDIGIFDFFIYPDTIKWSDSSSTTFTEIAPTKSVLTPNNWNGVNDLPF